MQGGLDGHACNECSWCGRDTPAHARSEVTLDSILDFLRAAILLKTVEIETELLGGLPEVGVVGSPSVGKESIDERPESTLQTCCFCSGVQGRRTRVLRRDRKVTETDAQIEIGHALP